jgi:hypothetical protein
MPTIPPLSSVTFTEHDAKFWHRMDAPPHFFISRTDSHFTGEGNKHVMASVARHLVRELP